MLPTADAEYLIKQGDRLFGKRGTLPSMWQHIAEQFYPERADFTAARSWGEDFADNLTTSYPLMVRRDFANALGQMQRPTSLHWFKMKVKGWGEDRADHPAREWLEWAEGVQRRAMYDRSSMFARASKEGDHDIAAFGQCVKSVTLNRDADGLLYRCWHIRDCAWAEDDQGRVTTLHRKWKAPVIDLCRLFMSRVHPKVRDKMSGPNADPFCEIDVRHIVMPAGLFTCDHAYMGKRSGVPFVSIYLDVENKHVMEVVGRPYFEYIVPRWETVGGSPYAYSPATVIALPDARLLQAMACTLLEAGEKAVNPPMTAVAGSLRSDLAIYAGGVTYIDEMYDERTGKAIEVLPQDKTGIPFGLDMAQDQRAMLREAFYLDKLTLPMFDGQAMTAYEVSQRVSDYIRQAAPIFEPLEQEDNAAVCDATFEILLRGGAFGSVQDMPQSLRGQDIEFDFESPLHDAIERQKATRFGEVLQLHASTVPVFPEATAQIDFGEAFRDALAGAGVPAKWLHSEDDAAAIIAQQKAIVQTQQLLSTMEQGAGIAKTLNEAGGGEALAA